MSKLSKDRKDTLKEIIKQLHEGVPPEEVKEKFGKFLEGVGAEEIARIEQELVQEGMPREELQMLCDVHLAVFKDQLQKQELHIPSWHPISILIEEHKIMLEHAEKLGAITKMIEEACDVVHVGEELKELQNIIKHLVEAEKHYLREENVLFPTVEKHGITEPPAIMWTEHNRIRETEKKLHMLVDKWNEMSFYEFKTKLSETAEPFCSMLPSHFSKENNILFPASLQVVTPEEWRDVRKEFDEIGYCCFTPQRMIAAMHETKQEKNAPDVAEDVLSFDAGSLTKDEIEGILDSLPVDISFIDREDSVKYFNKAEKRIFVRTKAVIGRKVQLCHPEKSVHIVNRIIEAFKTGKKDVAEFWITLGGRLVHIRYFAVRDKNGKYLGTMEVTQDLTDIKKIEGEKRLLDWKE